MVVQERERARREEEMRRREQQHDQWQMDAYAQSHYGYNPTLNQPSMPPRPYEDAQEYAESMSMSMPMQHHFQQPYEEMKDVARGGGPINFNDDAAYGDSATLAEDGLTSSDRRFLLSSADKRSLLYLLGVAYLNHAIELEFLRRYRASTHSFRRAREFARMRLGEQHSLTKMIEHAYRGAINLHPRKVIPPHMPMGPIPREPVTAMTRTMTLPPPHPSSANVSATIRRPSSVSSSTTRPSTSSARSDSASRPSSSSHKPTFSTSTHAVKWIESNLETDPMVARYLPVHFVPWNSFIEICGVATREIDEQSFAPLSMTEDDRRNTRANTFLPPATARNRHAPTSTSTTGKSRSKNRPSHTEEEKEEGQRSLLNGVSVDDVDADADADAEEDGPEVTESMLRARQLEQKRSLAQLQHAEVDASSNSGSRIPSSASATSSTPASNSAAAAVDDDASQVYQSEAVRRFFASSAAAASSLLPAHDEEAGYWSDPEVILSPIPSSSSPRGFKGGAGTVDSNGTSTSGHKTKSPTSTARASSAILRPRGRGRERIKHDPRSIGNIAALHARTKHARNTTKDDSASVNTKKRRKRTRMKLRYLVSSLMNTVIARSMFRASRLCIASPRVPPL